jgi:hypothetical protein
MPQKKPQKKAAPQNGAPAAADEKKASGPEAARKRLLERTAETWGASVASRMADRVARASKGKPSERAALWPLAAALSIESSVAHKALESADGWRAQQTLASVSKSLLEDIGGPKSEALSSQIALESLLSEDWDDEAAMWRPVAQLARVEVSGVAEDRWVWRPVCALGAAFVASGAARGGPRSAQLLWPAAARIMGWEERSAMSLPAGAWRPLASANAGAENEEGRKRRADAQRPLWRRLLAWASQLTGMAKSSNELDLTAIKAFCDRRAKDPASLHNPYDFQSRRGLQSWERERIEGAARAQRMANAELSAAWADALAKSGGERAKKPLGSAVGEQERMGEAMAFWAIEKAESWRAGPEWLLGPKADQELSLAEAVARCWPRESVGEPRDITHRERKLAAPGLPGAPMALNEWSLASPEFARAARETQALKRAFAGASTSDGARGLLMALGLMRGKKWAPGAWTQEAVEAIGSRQRSAKGVVAARAAAKIAESAKLYSSLGHSNLAISADERLAWPGMDEEMQAFAIELAERHVAIFEAQKIQAVLAGASGRKASRAKAAKASDPGAAQEAADAQAESKQRQEESIEAAQAPVAEPPRRARRL